MAKQDINIGAAPGDGTGDVVREAFRKSKENFDELYNRSVGDMNKSVYDSDDDGSVNSADKIKGIDAAANETFYGKDSNGVAGFYGFNTTHSHNEHEINGVRLSASNLTGSYAIDWNTASLFDLTIVGATTLTDTNLPISTNTKVIEMLITGDYALTLPAYWEKIPGSDNYLGTVRNHLVITCIKGDSGTEDVIYQLTNLSA
jgi:hypothetical protein